MAVRRAKNLTARLQIFNRIINYQLRPETAGSHAALIGVTARSFADPDVCTYLAREILIDLR